MTDDQPAMPEARDGLLPVEQVDRDAANALHVSRDGYHPTGSFCAAVRLGMNDDSEVVQAFARHRLRAAPPLPPAMGPVQMLLFCPKCGLKHVDEPEEPLAHHGGLDPVEPDGDHWTNPPHKSHLCHGCGCIWRPADVPTEGIAAIATIGKADTLDLNGVAAIATPQPGDTPCAPLSK